MAMAAKMPDISDEEEAEEVSLLTRVKVEASRQLCLALPMMGVNLLQFSLQLVSVMFVGHLGELDLASASIATSFCNVAGFSVLLGLASALETFCGQAYGAKQFHLMGVLLQRALLVLTIVSVFLSVLFYNMEVVLIFFGQAPGIAYRAGIYARFLIPALISYAFLQPLIRFLQTQGCVVPMFFCSGVSSLFHLLFCWMLIRQLKVGAYGAALSLSMSLWLNVVFLILVVVLTPRCKQCWPGFSLEMFNEIKEFLQLAVPSTIMVCLEWWSFEMLVLLSGILPNPKLEASVFAILLNTASLTFMIPYGIGAAASTRISNELGAGRASSARFAFFITVGLALIDAVTVASFLFVFRNFVGKAFSNESEVIKYVARIVPILCLVSFMDDIQGSIGGIARGCGWQASAAVANLGSYYLIGLPVAYVLAFHYNLKGKGLLIGILCGVTTQAAAFTSIAAFTNWKKQAEEAKKRIKLSEESSSLLLA